MTAVVVLVRRSELFQLAKWYGYELAGFLSRKAAVLEAGAADHTISSFRAYPRGACYLNTTQLEH